MPVDPLQSAEPPRRGAPAAGRHGQRRPHAGAVEVRRSSRRRRTVSAYRDGPRTVVLIPARMSADEEARWVTVMMERLAAQEERRFLDDTALADRARALSVRHLGGRARPSRVRWVTNQQSRWGSCTPSTGTIRISHRVQGMPEYVLDYVLLHELAHLLEPGHGPGFWHLLDGYPLTERARGYLEGVVAADRLPHLRPGPDGAHPGEAEEEPTDGPRIAGSDGEGRVTGPSGP